jgi:predicted choloylglycine hydrolase
VRVANKLQVYVVANVKLHNLSGDHHEIGVQQGKTCRQQIREALDKIPSYEFVKLMKPRFLPISLFMTLAKRRAEKLLKNDVFKYYPKQAQRLSGIAEGTGIDLSTILFLQGMELLIGKPSYRLEACSTLAFGPSRTTTGETILGKNFDYLNVLEPYQLTCETRPKNGYATLGCKMAPLAGMLDGMNEHGLSVTYNLAYALDEPKCYAPLSMALQEMLETCKDTDEAVRFMVQSKRGGHDAVLTLADAEGDVRTVEITSNHSTTGSMIEGQAINTNHYKSSEMQRIEIPRNAVYFGKGTPKEDVGVKVHESSEQRLKRAKNC